MDGQKCNNESEETYKKGGSKCVSKHSRDPSLLSSLSMVNKLVFICIISLVIGHAFAHEWPEHHEKHGKKSHDKKTHEKKSHKKKSKEKKGQDDLIQNPVPHDWFPVSNDPITTLGKGVGATNPLTGMESGADATGSEVYDGAGVQVSYSSSSSSSTTDFYPGDVKSESDSDFLQFLGATGQYDTSSTSSSSSDSSSDSSSKVSGGAKSDDVETNFKGKWEIHSANAGISGMHLMLLPNNKAIMFDSTVLGKSELQFPPGSCPLLNGVIDCYAHAAEYDIETAHVRPLRVHTDTWCSSGGVTVEGVLVQAGGYQGGGRVVRTLEMCETCDFVEHGESLSRQRWYSTQQALPDGRFIVVGGRDDTARSYEIIPPIGVKTPLEQNFKLPFLVETTDTFPGAENNLYPHVHLSSDGNLFIFANYKSILYNYEKHQVVRRFPDLPGGARNYPGSAPSAILPIKIPRDKTKKIVPVEVAICGGAPREAFQVREQKNQYLTALKSCGRIKITDPNSKWKMEQMPGPRLMGDMLILPTGDLIIVNGAKKGSAGWEYAEDPYYSPVIYRPSKPRDKRFAELAPSKIARMYHSSAIVLPDGKVLVAGSNTHARYDYAAKYPTELRVEKFSPPYLDPSLAMYAPTILSNYGQTILKYGQEFEVNVRMLMEAKSKDLKVTMYSPAFTTHGISMNQRLCVLPQIGVSGVPASTTIKVRAPPSGAVAPPGYYMLFVVHRGVPSKSVWIRIKN